MNQLKLLLVAIACFILVVTAYNVFERSTTKSSLIDYKIGEMRFLEMSGDLKKLDPIPVILEDGSDFVIDASSNKVRLINLWASWCVPCLKEMPALDRLQATLGGDKFEVITINIDQKGVPRARQYLDKLGLSNLKIYADPTMAVAYSLSDGRLPMTHIIDKKGNMVANYLGPLDWDSPDAVALFNHLMKE